ncbi:MAG: hypothetical protein GWO16_00975, partial [Gammaproteobacteria bacterium]|nr:hypothetical protein [Gammaproteobacteria bacterium]NIR28264.1 hypothetical protein [Gammaproteobacteria bacterium]NIR96712.1 hypothetical protein [Gammaproteobacteria bacterium]NIT62412.1 hypothetical protein [Gammaproteobacteria bacterium]NIV19345.1 hypothetical protein [Gammaproteobacteria bacterium]
MAPRRQWRTPSEDDMAEVVMYTRTFCPFCVRAKGLLADKGVAYREI